MKYGVEVEGRFKGVPTIFLDVDELTLVKASDPIGRFYISIDRNFTDNEVNVIDALLEAKKSVVIETLWVFCLPVFIKQNCHIVLRIDRPDFWGLKSTDEVKFVQGLTVRTCPVETMFKTKPSDFDKDVGVKK